MLISDWSSDVGSSDLEVVDQIMREEQHFAAAPQAFFEAWRRGVEIAGTQWFGNGTREGLNQAKSKWDLRPDMLRANDALGVLRSGERMFLSALRSEESCGGQGGGRTFRSRWLA